MQKQDAKRAEKLSVQKMVFPCEGTGSGHPRVYLKIDPTSKNAVCPYCDRIYEFHGDDMGGH